MSAEFLSIHPDNPQPRFIKMACKILRDGGVAVVPTDSSYAFCVTVVQPQCQPILLMLYAVLWSKRTLWSVLRKFVRSVRTITLL